ncbi:MAG TPA: ABC transporter ATP-binding protein [Chloroflexota bacterium]|nr:ABC transporter ATP-binding protein [Chloroflexota bacterium]
MSAAVATPGAAARPRSGLEESLRAFRVLMSFAFTAAPREATLFLLCGAVMALRGPIGALGAKLFVDAALARDLSALLGATALLSAAAGVGLLNTLYYLDFLFAVAEKAGLEANRRLMGLMAGVPGLAHHELPEYLKELDVLREQRNGLAWMTNATAGMVRVAVQLVATVLLFTQLHPALLLLPLFGLGSFWAGRRARTLQHQAAEDTAEFERRRRHLFELGTAAGAGKELRVFGLQRELIARHDASAREVIRRRNRADWQSAGLSVLGALLFVAGYLGAIALVLWQALQGRATPGDVVLTVGLAAGMDGVVQTAVAYGTGFLFNLRVARRYLWLTDYAARGSLSVAEPLAVPDRIAEGIELREVTFRYPGTEAGEGARPILDGISLQLPAGAVVALVGENGAGKTTLVKLLCRFYEPDAGHILVDGTSLERFPVEAWRARTSAAFQDFARFEFLVREAVGVGDLPRAGDTAAVQDALRRAGGEDVPRRLPHGLETQLGTAWEGGTELSGGQWQKLALGRGMMRPRPLLVVFDEPTSALDPQTEHALFERIAAAARSGADDAGTITVLVSHRFSTVRMADKIVVLGDGRIVEQGSHAELMRRDGPYAELYRLQSRAYR